MFEALAKIRAALDSYALQPDPDIITSVSTVDALLLHVKQQANHPRAAFLQAIVRVAEEIDRGEGDETVSDRLKQAEAARETLNESAKQVRALGSPVVAELLECIAENVGKHAAAAVLTPRPEWVNNGANWKLDFGVKILWPSALETNPGKRAARLPAAIRTLATLLEPSTPSLNKMLKNLLQTVGINVSQHAVQSALRPLSESTPK